MSPTEAERLCKGSGSPEAQLAERVLQSLSQGPRAFILDKRLEDGQALIRLLSSAGVSRLLQISDLGSLLVVYIDKSKLERACLYEECASKIDPVERRQCSKECASRKLDEVTAAVAKGLCDAVS